MKFAQANLNCVGTVDFVTKIKRFPCLPLRTRKPSAEFSLRGLRGARSLAPGPVAAPRGRPSAAGHGGHLLGLPVLPEAAGREGSMFGLTEQQALRGKAVRTQVPALSAASKGARSRSRSLGGGSLARARGAAYSTLLSTTRLLSSRTRAPAPAASFLHAACNGGRVVPGTEANPWPPPLPQPQLLQPRTSPPGVFGLPGKEAAGTLGVVVHAGRWPAQERWEESGAKATPPGGWGSYLSFGVGSGPPQTQLSRS